MLLFDLVFVIPNIQLAYFLQLSVMVDEHDVFQPFLVDILDKIQEVLVSAGTHRGRIRRSRAQSQLLIFMKVGCRII